jgi:hypothetical protein
MLHKSCGAILAFSTLVLAAPDQAWKVKPITDWTEADARDVMTDSPWAKTVVATFDDKASPASAARLDVGKRGFNGRGGQGKAPVPTRAPRLVLRWESALPMREAELKARDTGAPDIEEGYFAITVYGLPRGTVTDDSKQMGGILKKQAVLRRNAKKDVRPASVQIVLHDDGPVLVYLFEKSDDFNWRDHNIEFDAQVGQWKFTQSFSTDEMMFHGELAL